MKIIVDTHVHLYPFYDLSFALKTLVKNLSSLCPEETLKAAFLTDRFQYRFHEDFLQGKIRFNEPDLSVTLCADQKTLLVNSGGSMLYLFPGYQINCTEKLELLAMGLSTPLPDGISLDETLKEIRNQRAIPILPWGAGKWLFKRGKIVERLIPLAKDYSLLFADTFMRPACLPDSRLIKKIHRVQKFLLSGSDPLPMKGEEEFLGKYATLFEGEFDPQNPLFSMQAILLSGFQPFTSLGKRTTLPHFILRHLRYHSR